MIYEPHKYRITAGGRKVCVSFCGFDGDDVLRISGYFLQVSKLCRVEFRGIDWKEVARYTPLDNVIDVHIAHLRRKLDEPFRKKLLHTVRGVGFVLREEAP